MKNKPSSFIKCKYCNGKGNRSNKNRISICSYCKGDAYVKNPVLYSCNMCGLSLMHGKYEEAFGLIDQSITGEYGSPHLFDMTTYEFSLCEKCIRNMFKSFTIPPKVRHGHEEGSFNSDQACYEYRDFYKSKEFEEKYLAGKCNYIIGCNNKAKYTVVENNGALSKTSVCYKHSRSTIDRYDGKKMWEDVVNFVPEHIRILE